MTLPGGTYTYIMNILEHGGLIVLSVILIIMAGCGPNETDKHPDINYLPRTDSIKGTISNRVLDRSNHVWRNDSITIGGNDLKSSPILGKVDGAVYDSTVERLYILDGEYSEVKVYYKGGGYVGTIGQSGAGPGEFQSPESIGILRRGLKTMLYVSDRHRRNNIFTGAPSDPVQHSDLFKTSFITLDMCTTGSNIYMHGFHMDSGGGSTIHRYKKTEHVNSFGPVYKSIDSHVKSRLSTGSLGCDEQNDIVIFGFYHSGLLYAYRNDGQHLWTSQINSFRPQPIFQGISDKGTTSLTYHYSKGRDRLINIVDTYGDSILVQTQRITTEAGPLSSQESLIFTYIVSSITGDGNLVSKNNSILYESQKNLIVSEKTNSRPNITIYK